MGVEREKRNILVLLALSLWMGFSSGTQTGREEGMERREGEKEEDGEKQERCYGFL